MNSASYGITAEMNPTHLGSKTGPSTCTRSATPSASRCTRSSSRAYRFPPLAALITGAARLMLAILETCVAEFGGCHVMADTDSMAIVANQHGGLIACNGGPHQLPDGTPAVYALSRSQVEAIVARFGSLSPYDPDLIESVLKIENVNYDKQGNCLPLHGFSISAKRYALNTPDADMR